MEEIIWCPNECRKLNRVEINRWCIFFVQGSIAKEVSFSFLLPIEKEKDVQIMVVALTPTGFKTIRGLELLKLQRILQCREEISQEPHSGFLAIITGVIGEIKVIATQFDVSYFDSAVETIIITQCHCL